MPGLSKAPQYRPDLGILCRASALAVAVATVRSCDRLRNTEYPVLSPLSHNTWSCMVLPIYRLIHVGAFRTPLAGGTGYVIPACRAPRRCSNGLFSLDHIKRPAVDRSSTSSVSACGRLIALDTEGVGKATGEPNGKWTCLYITLWLVASRHSHREGTLA